VEERPVAGGGVVVAAAVDTEGFSANSSVVKRFGAAKGRERSKEGLIANGRVEAAAAVIQCGIAIGSVTDAEVPTRLAGRVIRQRARPPAGVAKVVASVIGGGHLAPARDSAQHDNEAGDDYSTAQYFIHGLLP